MKSGSKNNHLSDMTNRYSIISAIKEFSTESHCDKKQCFFPQESYMALSFSFVLVSYRKSPSR